MGNYVSVSIETHLFFARIMKEHALFLQVGFPCKDKAWIQKADCLRKEFEEILSEALEITDGRVSADIIKSGELVTQFTMPAEKRTCKLTGIEIDSHITEKEHNLQCRRESGNDRATMRLVDVLNEKALCALNRLIDFKENILREVRGCCLFTANYPLLIDHILREAKLYRSILQELRQNRNMTRVHLREQEEFWNQIMMEHALFIRGLLDPTEEQLIETADDFAADYKKLLEITKKQDCKAAEKVTRASLEKTLQYKAFKTAGTDGILKCQIDSIILPLLADHVLREANHYIRVMECDGVGWE